MAAEDSSCAGFGGVGPAPSTDRVPSSTGWVSSAIGVPSVSALLRPTPSTRPRAAATRGRRRSASISSTRVPVRASDPASCTTVVVLPSDSSALVTMITRGWLSTETNRRLASSRPKLSASGEPGAGTAPVLRTASSSGTPPRAGAAAATAAAASLRTVVSVRSRSTAASAPSSRPRTSPAPASAGQPTEDGVLGRSGAAMMETVIGTPVDPLLSSSPSIVPNCWITASAVRCARMGAGSVTDTSSTTVPGTTSAWMRSVSCPGVIGSPSSSTTRVASSRLTSSWA